MHLFIVSSLLAQVNLIIFDSKYVLVHVEINTNYD